MVLRVDAPTQADLGTLTLVASAFSSRNMKGSINMLLRVDVPTRAGIGTLTLVASAFSSRNMKGSINMVLRKLQMKKKLKLSEITKISDKLRKTETDLKRPDKCDLCFKSVSETTLSENILTS